MSDGYRHKVTGELYTTREVGGLEPVVRQLRDRNGGYSPRLAVTRWWGGAPRNPVWVMVSNLELVTPSPDTPDPTAGASMPEEVILGASAPAPEHTREEWAQIENDLKAGPNPQQQWLIDRGQELRTRAFQVAGELSFHAGNAITAIVDGELYTARAALDQEIARRYPPADRMPEEATDE